MLSGGLISPPHNHAVAFWDSDRDIVAAIARHVAGGLRLGEPALVVATHDHLIALDDALLALGCDPAAARESGHFIALDAHGTLDTFMEDGTPDRKAFRERVGGLVDAVRGDAPIVRVFGEMVSILWDDDNVAGALELEALWNDLSQDREFSLLCAYPSTVLDADSLSDIGSVCHLHATVISPEKYDATWPAPYGRGNKHWSEVFLPVPKAIPAVRRFVVSVLELWSSGHLGQDAALVSTEMATIVGSHVGSPFRVCLERSARGVVIAIEEAGHSSIEDRVVTIENISDPSMTVVAGVADRWGWDMHPDRKVIWAEFVTSPEMAGVELPA